MRPKSSAFPTPETPAKGREGVPCRDARGRLCGAAVLLVLGIIAALGGTAIWNGWVKPVGFREHGLIELILFGAELFLLVWSYLTAVVRGPGFVPLGWAPADGELEDLLIKQPGAWPMDNDVPTHDCLQWCRHCSGFKAPRAHHCSTCGRCVLWMDHHCPWTNTCIGHDNIKAFTLFVHYVPVACLHALLIHSEVPARLIRILYKKTISHFWRYLWATRSLITLLMCVACLVVGLLVGSLAWEMHASLDANVTYIEDLIIDKAQVRRLRSQESKFVFPYDLGRRRNWELVMGARGWRWLLPTRTSCGHDSFWPPLKDGCGPLDLSTEQIMQKAHKLSKSWIMRVTQDFVGSSGCCGSCCCAPFFWCRMLYRLGCRAVCCCEVCGETLLTTHVGEELLVSYRGDDWVFGSKVPEGPDAPGGWIPWQCVDKEKAAKYQVPLQAAIQGPWEKASGMTIMVNGVCVRANSSRTPSALRSEGGSTWLQGVRLLECDSHAARWSNGETWTRPKVLPKPIRLEDEEQTQDVLDGNHRHEDKKDL